MGIKSWELSHGNNAELEDSLLRNSTFFVPFISFSELENCPLAVSKLWTIAIPPH